ncbi:MAG: type II/IV secretion system protein [Ignavibacteriae bacterium]|nr:type II/IV secretion system protein [Ignavibacteriota bacterium]MCB9207736.1 type II/IV secretion system protein [Ignavibacteriales bacterium]MCB9258506.1 type II/IV secretion system protein [Ignavibacteriales bacterium]
MVEERIEMTDKIGYLLLKKGIIDLDILQKALETKEKDLNGKKRNLGQILVQEFGFDHDIVFREIAILYAFKEINFNIEEFNDQRISQLQNILNESGEDVKKLLLDHKVLPYKFDDRIRDKLILAAVDPTDRALTKIAYALKAKKFELNFIKKRDYDKLSDLLVPQENEFLQMVESSEEFMDVEIDDSGVSEEQLDSEINKSALVNLVEGALVEGVRRGVSDIHIFPASGKRTEIHFRQDGKLARWYVQDNTLPEAVMAVVKDRAKGLDRFERERAQDGFIQRQIDNHIIRFRVSVLPMVGTELKNKFESIVIRILDDRNVIRDLSKLGLVGYAKSAFQKAINQPQGMVILTGPTGSGKSTTLIAALYQVIDPSVNVLTVEDPVEYVIEGARQLKIGHKMNFEQAIRAILRHDPDIVLVGEMRDKETAETAVKLANTGHLTFSTLHTNDAPSAVARLYKMGVEPFLIAYAINIIVAQRLIRKLCDHCKTRVTEFDEVDMAAAGLDINEWKNYEVYDSVGCEKCNKTGFKGRLAVHEALYFTKEIREIIVRSGVEVDEEKIRVQARKDGTLTLRDNGFEKVKLGLTSIQEVIGATMED